jgi:hypothetical protein
MGFPTGYGPAAPVSPGVVTTDMRRALFQNALRLPPEELPDLRRLCRELGPAAWREADGGTEFSIDFGKLNGAGYAELAAFVEDRLNRAEADTLSLALASRAGRVSLPQVGLDTLGMRGGPVGLRAREEYSRRPRSPPAALAARERGWTARAAPAPLRAGRMWEPPPPLPSAAERARARGGVPSGSLPPPLMPRSATAAELGGGRGPRGRAAVSMQLLQLPLGRGRSATELSAGEASPPRSGRVHLLPLAFGPTPDGLGVGVARLDPRVACARAAVDATQRRETALRALCAFADALPPPRALSAHVAHPLRSRLRVKFGRLLAALRVATADAVEALREADERLGPHSNADIAAAEQQPAVSRSRPTSAGKPRSAAPLAWPAPPPPMPEAGFESHARAFAEYRLGYARKLGEDTLWLPCPVETDPLLLRWFTRLTLELELAGFAPDLCAESSHPAEELARLRRTAVRWADARAQRARAEAAAGRRPPTAPAAAAAEPHVGASKRSQRVEVLLYGGLGGYAARLAQLGGRSQHKAATAIAACVRGMLARRARDGARGARRLARARAMRSGVGYVSMRRWILHMAVEAHAVRAARRTAVAHAEADAAAAYAAADAAAAREASFSLRSSRVGTPVSQPRGRSGGGGESATLARSLAERVADAAEEAALRRVAELQVSRATRADAAVRARSRGLPRGIYRLSARRARDGAVLIAPWHVGAHSAPSLRAHPAPSSPRSRASVASTRWYSASSRTRARTLPSSSTLSREGRSDARRAASAAIRLCARCCTLRAAPRARLCPPSAPPGVPPSAAAHPFFLPSCPAFLHNAQRRVRAQDPDRAAQARAPARLQGLGRAAQARARTGTTNIAPRRAARASDPAARRQRSTRAPGR